MELILSMTASGSILFLGILIICYSRKNVFTPKHKYFLLKTALLLHFIPLAWAIILMKNWIYAIFHVPASDSFFFHGKSKVIMISSNELHLNHAFQLELIGWCLWISIAVIIFCFQAYKRIQIRRTILKASVETITPDILQIKNKYQQILHIKKEIPIYTTNASLPPFTTGILHPIIVLPQTLDTFQTDVAIYHELCHIKYQDGLVLLFRSFMLGIYWFNPIVYFLDFALSTSCELACDDEVSKKMSPQEKKSYGYFILNTSGRNFGNDNSHIIALNSSNKKILKERIDCIMSKKTTKTKVNIVFSAILCLCSTFPAFAYETPNKIQFENHSDYNIFLENDDDFIRFTPNSDASDWNTKVTYNSEFIDQAGNSYKVDNAAITQKNCQHKFKHGTYQKHIPKPKGACSLEVFNAQRCEKCGYVNILNRISQTTFDVCPH